MSEIRPIVFNLSGVAEDDRFGQQHVSALMHIAPFISVKTFEDGSSQRLIGVDLTNSFVNPGSMIHDRVHTKGFYLDDVDVRMWLGDSIDNPDTRFLLQREDPDPSQSNQGGSISTSSDFGVSGEVGVSGRSPSASIGASFSQSQSQSHELKDFVFTSESTNLVLRHFYFMQQFGGGHYSGPRSLLVSGATSGARLGELPLLSRARFPIFSKVIWGSVDDEGLNADFVRVSVELEGDFAICEATNTFFNGVTFRDNVKQLIWTKSIDIPLPRP